MSTDLKRTREPIFNLPPVVFVSVLVMVAIHVARMLLTEDQDDLLIGYLAFAPERYFENAGEDAVWPGGLLSELVSPFTYALLHNDYLHLISNCTVFAAIGNHLARRMTAVQFLLFCLLMAPVSAVGQLLIAGYQSAPVVGVSGVICAMLGAMARLIPERKLLDWYDRDESVSNSDSPVIDTVGELRPVAHRLSGESGRRTRVPVAIALRDPRVIRFILGFGVLNVLLVFSAPILISGGASVAWMVHIAGFIGGFFLFPYFDGGQR